jgi:hypothetical protein
MSNLVVERLPGAFAAEIAALYASAAHSGVIPDGRRAYVLTAVARLKAKYGAKIVSLRKFYPAAIVDDTERAIVRIENEHAATLAA